MALLAIGAFMMVLLSAAAEGTEPYTDVVILSTTDLHGKCWDTNVLTGQKEERNILRVSTAVKEYRETYGEQQVLLIDNGDLFQGTLVSEHQLLQKAKGLSDVPPAMALCVREIGYTACVLGNHEFDYPWGVMHETYQWLEAAGVPVLAANICYDGTLERTGAGENAFTPYVICAYLRQSMHRVLYQQANSLAVNGLGGENVKFEVGTPIYKITLWILTGLLAVYLIYSILKMIQYGRMTESQFANSRERTKKARMIKNIILSAVLLALVVVFFIVYFPLLQKAFLL